MLFLGHLGAPKGRDQATPKWEGGRDNHRKRDSGGVGDSPVHRDSADSSPCAYLAGEVGRDAEGSFVHTKALAIKMHFGRATDSTHCYQAPWWRVLYMQRQLAFRK